MQRDTSKTPEGRSATFTVQGLGFFFFWEDFLTSIAARFLVTFFFTMIFLSRLGRRYWEAFFFVFLIS